MRLQVSETESADIGKLIQLIEESKVPLAEEGFKFEAIKEKHANRLALTVEERDLVLNVARKADEWKKAVESSALTEPEQTLPGC